MSVAPSLRYSTFGPVTSGTVDLEIDWPVQNALLEVVVWRRRGTVTTVLVAPGAWSFVPAGIGGRVVLAQPAQGQDEYIVFGRYLPQRAANLTQGDRNSTKKLNREFDRIWQSLQEQHTRAEQLAASFEFLNTQAVRVPSGQTAPVLDKTPFMGVGGLLGMDASGQIVRIPAGTPGATVNRSQIIDAGTFGKDWLALSAPQQAQSFANIWVGTTYYNVQMRHQLDGTAGDRAKILAAFDAAPKGCEMHFADVSSPITAGMVLNKQVDLHWHNTVWRIDMGANDADDLLTIEIPAANTLTGDQRRMVMRGLIFYSISGGNNGINIKKGAPGQAGLLNLYEHILGYADYNPTANPNGFAFRITDPDSHWNEINLCLFAGRGIGHFGADGWRISKTQFFGELGIYINTVPGAFVTTVEGCTGSMDGLAFHVARGSNARFVNNSWEQAAIANTGIYNVQGLIQPGSSSPIHGVAFSDNFGAGANVGAALRIDPGATIVQDIMFDKSIFHPGSTGLDVQIVGASVRHTRFHTSNIYRGTRAGADPTWPGAVSDLGTGTRGVWKDISQVMAFDSGWGAVAGSRAMIDPHSLEVKFDATLVPGALATNTLIGTLIPAYRPHKLFLVAVQPNSGTTARAISIDQNGEMRVWAAPFVGSILDLTPLRWASKAVANYNPGD